MAVAAARPIRRPLTTPASIERASFAAWPALAGLVGLSFAIRTVVGWLRETPLYLGDEYLYAALGRSLAESGRPIVRGHAANFPALLQPILTAPAWLVGDVGTAYHLVQTISALAMSLAAIPVFWLARRLGLSKGLSLSLAALALALPDLIYASWVVAEPFAYPLVLGAAAAGIAAIAWPTRRAQLAFVALAALAAFARIQFILFPACFLATVLAVGLRERRLRAALREQLLPLFILAVPVAVALVLGPARVLAFYKGVIDVHVDPASLVGPTGANLLVLLYASGFVLMPGAILGLGLAIARPRTRAELAFAFMTLILTLTLLLEAGLFGAVDHPQERYVFYALPLVAIGFGLHASRGWPYRLHHALLASGLVTVAAAFPLAGYAAADAKMHSPLLYGAYRLEQWFATPGSGSLAIALVATVAVAVVVACSRRPRIATAAALSLAILLCSGFAAAAAVFDRENTSTARHSFFGSDPSWIDHAHVGDVTMVRNVSGERGAAFQQLFWNRSLKRVVLMPGAFQIDPFSADGLRVASDGTLRDEAGPLTGALLLDEHAVTMRLRGAKKVGSAPGFWLYKPVGTPRVSLLAVGRYHDGWLAGNGSIELWPRAGFERLSGTLVVSLEAPTHLATGTSVQLRLPSGRNLVVRIPRHGTATARIRVSSAGPWRLLFRSRITGYVGVRPVSVMASVPRLVPGPCRCPALPPAPGSPAASGQSA